MRAAFGCAALLAACTPEAPGPGPACLVELAPHPGHVASEAVAVGGGRRAVVAGHSVDARGARHAAVWSVAGAGCGASLPARLLPRPDAATLSPAGADALPDAPFETLARAVDAHGRVVGAAVAEARAAALLWSEGGVSVLASPTRRIARAEATAVSGGSAAGDLRTPGGERLGFVHADGVSHTLTPLSHVVAMAQRAGLGTLLAGARSTREGSGLPGGAVLWLDRGHGEPTLAALPLAEVAAVALAATPAGASRDSAWVVGSEAVQAGSRPVRLAVALPGLAPGERVVLALPEGAAHARARAVDALGRAVGSVDGHAALWDRDARHVDLHATSGESQWQLEEATGISASGLVVGRGRRGEQRRGFALLPADAAAEIAEGPWPEAPTPAAGGAPATSGPRPTLHVALEGARSCQRVAGDTALALRAVVRAGTGLAELALLADGRTVARSAEPVLEASWAPAHGVHCVQARAAGGAGDVAWSDPVCVQGGPGLADYAFEILEGELPQDASEGFGIGPAGEVVGEAGDRPCRWSEGRVRCLDLDGLAVAVNAFGEAAVTDWNGPVRVWSADGGTRALASSPPREQVFLDIDDAGNRLHATYGHSPDHLVLERADGSVLASPAVGLVPVVPFFPWIRPRLVEAPRVSATNLLPEEAQPRAGAGRLRLRPNDWDLSGAFDAGLRLVPGALARRQPGGAAVGFLDLEDAGVSTAHTGLGLERLPRAIHAARFAEGRVHDLHQLGQRSYAADLSAGGLVVGAFQRDGDPEEAVAEPRAWRAFLHACGVQHDLGAALPPGSGWVPRRANAVNAAGQITGLAVHADGRARGYRLTPRP